MSSLQSQEHGDLGNSFHELSARESREIRDNYLERQPVAIIGGTRTPFVRSGGQFKDYGQLELGTHAVVEAVKKLDLNPDKIDEIVYGTVVVNPNLSDIAREIVLNSGLPKTIHGNTITKACTTSLDTVRRLVDDIVLGRAHIGIAGGVESLSNPTLTFSPKAQDLFLELSRARSLTQRLKILAKWRPRMAIPIPPSPTEPSTGMTMGQHCEQTSQELQIPRSEQDRLAYLSHIRAAAAQQAGFLNQEIAAYRGVDRDDIIRPSTSLEKLAALRPVFDREHGTLTAGNSTALTDGASALCLMSEQEAQRQDREILGYISGIEFAAIDPADGLLQAPGVALPRLLNKHGLGVDDIDRFEVHEAFAAQVLGNQKIWEQGWSKYDVSPIGRLPEERTNVNGGSLALGHPFAATGARLIMSLVNELRRSDLKVGVISVCAAGGRACAMLIRR